MGSTTMQARQERMGWRWAVALLPLVMVVHEAHESAHTLVGRIACGRWAERDFSRWSIQDCDSFWPTLAGPLLSYALMAWGLLLLRGRLRWPGLALIFAANPLARMVTAAMGRGDEALVARIWQGGEAGWPVLASGAVVMLLGSVALVGAWQALAGVRARAAAFAFGAVIGMALTGSLLPVFNRLLQAGVLAAPVAGAPALVHLVTVVCLFGLAVCMRWLANPARLKGAGSPG